MNIKKENQLFNSFMSGMRDNDDNIIPIITENDELLKSQVPDILPILPLKNTVLFPGVVIPISITREKSVNLVKDVYKKNKFITQRFFIVLYHTNANL